MTTLDQRNISNLHNQIRYFDNDPLIPSDLRITINTGVPGFQSIVYKPQMSIPDTKEKKIWFTPLVRLNQRIVDQVPPEYRIKQFFNKGLYESLLRYHGLVPIKKEDHELEDAEKEAALDAKSVSVSEKKVEKAQRRLAAAQEAAQRTNIRPAGEFENDGAKSDELTIKESGKDDDMMGGGLSEAYDRYIMAKKENDDYKKYLTTDQYKQYIKNQDLIKKKLYVDDVKDSTGKIIKDGTYRVENKLRRLMQTRKKADEINKLKEVTSANKAKLEEITSANKAKLESDRIAKNVSDANKAVYANNVLARKIADKKAADKKAVDKITSELSAANESLREAQVELQQKQSDQSVSDNNLRRIKASKSDPAQNKASSKAAAVLALNEAKIRGNFNNNIKVTLDTLFKNGSILYIDKKPYVIVDTQMIQGDWSLDVKPAEMATIYNASQSNIYDKAEQVRRVELETAGLTSFTGENWIDRYPQFDKKYSRTTLNPGNGQNTRPTTNPRPLPYKPEDGKGQLVTRPTTRPTTTPRSRDDDKGFLDRKQIEQQQKRRPTRGETLVDRFNEKLGRRENYTTSFRSYFGVTKDTSNLHGGRPRNFYNIINTMLKELDKDKPSKPRVTNKIKGDFEKYAQKSRRDASRTASDSLTLTHYIDVIQSINTYENKGAGDCFFDAIAQALNLHNVDESNKIIPSNQCQDTRGLEYEFFDQACIRKAVIDTIKDAIDFIRDNYNTADDSTRREYDEQLKEICREIQVGNIRGIQNILRSTDKEKRNKEIEEFKERINNYMSNPSYWGTDVTMKYLNQGSLKYLGITLRTIIIKQNIRGENYEIDAAINNIDPNGNEHLVFLYNDKDIHYVLLTFKDFKGIDRSIFTLEQIPFVFWCYIVIFMVSMMDNEFIANDETKSSLASVNSTFDIISAHNSLIKKDSEYKRKLCAFLSKEDGFCIRSSQDMVNEARSKIRRQSRKNVTFSDDVKLPVRTPNRMSLRNKLPDSSSEIETQTDRSDGDESNAETTDNDSDKMGGSPYYQYGGLNEVEKHREDYQRNNYTRYPGIPVAYPVENTRVEEIDKSISSVFVTIDLELHKGKTISNSELASAKCNHQYNAIKHSFAVLTGTPYIIAPVYGGTRRVRRNNGTHKKRQNVRNTSRKRRNTTNKRR